MIDPTALEAFNSKLTVDLNNIKTMTPAQLDQVKVTGSNAENLLKNKDFALFVHQWKFEQLDILSAINGHTADDDNRRIAISNQLKGIDSFVTSLKRHVYMKQTAVKLQNAPADSSEQEQHLTKKVVYRP